MNAEAIDPRFIAAPPLARTGPASGSPLLIGETVMMGRIAFVNGTGERF